MAEHSNKVPVFAFQPTATKALTDYDAVMAFELFLGRPPESAAVIDFHKAQTFPNMMAGCLASSEFADGVVRPVQAGLPIRRGDYRGKPSGEQLEWLSRFVAFDAGQLASLEAAPDWAAFFKALHAVGGVDLAGDAPADAIDAVLARLEQMRTMLSEVEQAVRRIRDDQV